MVVRCVMDRVSGIREREGYTNGMEYQDQRRFYIHAWNATFPKSEWRSTSHEKILGGWSSLKLSQQAKDRPPFTPKDDTSSRESNHEPLALLLVTSPIHPIYRSSPLIMTDETSPQTPHVRKRKERESRTPSPPPSSGLLGRLSSYFKRRRTSVTPPKASNGINGTNGPLGESSQERSRARPRAPSITLPVGTLRMESQSPQADQRTSKPLQSAARPTSHASSSNGTSASTLPNVTTPTASFNVAPFAQGISDKPKSVLRKPIHGTKSPRTNATVSSSSSSSSRVNPKRTSFQSGTLYRSKFASHSSHMPFTRKGTPYKTQSLSFSKSVPSSTSAPPSKTYQATPYKTQTLAFRGTTTPTATSSTTGKTYKTTPYKVQSVGFTTSSSSPHSSTATQSSTMKKYNLTPRFKRSFHSKSILLTGGLGSGIGVGSVSASASSSSSLSRRKATPYKSERSRRNAQYAQKTMEELSKLTSWDGETLEQRPSTKPGTGGWSHSSMQEQQFGPPKAVRLSLNQSVTPGGRLGNQRPFSEDRRERRRSGQPNTFDGEVVMGRDYWNRPQESVEHQQHHRQQQSESNSYMGTLVVPQAPKEEKLVKRARTNSTSILNDTLEKASSSSSIISSSSPTKSLGFGIVGSPTPTKGAVEEYFELEPRSCLPRMDGCVHFPVEKVFGTDLNYTELLGPSSTGELKNEWMDSILEGKYTPSKDQKQSFQLEPAMHTSTVKKKLPFSFMPTEKVKDKESKTTTTGAMKALSSLKKELHAKPSSMTKAAPPAGSGWGNMFAMKPGEWKCDVCSVKNPKEAEKCQSCGSDKGTKASMGGNPSESKDAAASSSNKDGFISLAEIGASHSPGAGFTFGYAAQKKSDGTKTSTSSGAGFSFGYAASSNGEKEKSDGAKTSASAFSFGSKPAAPAAASSSETKVGGFSFGAPSSSAPPQSDSKTEKRTAFSFGASTASAPPESKPSTSSSTGTTFAFGASSSADKNATKPTATPTVASTGFSFGSTSSTKAADTPAPSFQFGSSASSTKGPEGENFYIETLLLKIVFMNLIKMHLSKFSSCIFLWFKSSSGDAK